MIVSIFASYVSKYSTHLFKKKNTPTFGQDMTGDEPPPSYWK